MNRKSQQGNFLKSTIGLLSLISAISLQQASASPDIERWSTSNGATVLYVHTPDLPMVDVRVIFDAGSARDGKQSGIASMTNALLSAGAGERGEEAIAETIGSLGAVLGASSLRDMAVVSLRSLSDERLLNSALEVTADLIHRPYFPESAFERERNRQLIGIQAQKQSPSTIASKKFFRMMYGSHPYAEPSGGTEQSVKSIKRNNLKSFHARYYVGNNALVAIVGAVDRGRAKEIAEQVVGALPAGEAAAEIAAPITAQAGEEEYIEYPSVQSHILLGHPVVKRGDIDYFDLYVGNHILGGSGLVSKISEEVRENRGLAYSAYSYFSPMRRAGPFQAGLQTKNESRDEALEVLRKTIADFIEHGPALDDLENSKKNITGGFPLRIDSNKKIVSYLGVIGFYGLPDSYLDDFNRKINAVSAASIKDAFKRRVRPAEMVTVIVGGEVKKKSAIEEKDVH